MMVNGCLPFVPIDLPTSNQMPPCDAQIPIVFVHGYLASGDTYSLPIQRFEQNGYCADRLFTFDWNSIGFENDLGKLTQFINEVLNSTNMEKVILMGHSAGSFLGYDFLEHEYQSELVEKYVNIGGHAAEDPAGPTANIPTLNIWSPDDYVVTGGNIAGAINLELPGKDHFEVVTSAESFIAMYQFIFGIPPESSVIEKHADKIISGKAVSFSENLITDDTKIEIYEVNPSTGIRTTALPVDAFIIDEFGYWGPFSATSNVYYEFLVYTGKPGDRPIHYYPEPFIRSNQTLYLRTYPPAGSLAAALLNVIPRDDEQSISGIFSTNRSIQVGRDQLTADGINLSTNEFASPEQFSVAIFLYDDNDNMETDLYSVPTFNKIQNLTGVDFFKHVEIPDHTEYIFNGEARRVPNWRSASDGISVAMFK